MMYNYQLFLKIVNLECSLSIIYVCFVARALETANH
jgi:hypothetical protein